MGGVRGFLEMNTLPFDVMNLALKLHGPQNEGIAAGFP